MSCIFSLFLLLLFDMKILFLTIAQIISYKIQDAKTL